MKILTKEEQQEHYNATLTGGLLGGAGGISAGLLGVFAASRRYPAFRNLTLPLRAFLVTSSGTFAAIVSADSYSRRYERSRHPELAYQSDGQESIEQQARALRSTRQKTMDWLSDNRYSIVFGSWVASMGTAMGIVGRNPYLTAAQKIVQARVYAQGLTIAVVIISLAFETSDSSRGKGRWETVKVLDPNDPTHQHMIEKRIHHEAYEGEDQWRDMVEAEESRLKQRDRARRAYQKKNGNGNGNGQGDEKESKKSEGKSEEKESKKSEGKSEEKESKKSEGKSDEKSEQSSKSSGGKDEKAKA